MLRVSPVHCLQDASRANHCITMLRAGMPPKKQRQQTRFERREQGDAARECSDETSGSENPGSTVDTPIAVPGDEVRVPPSCCSRST